MEGKGGAARPHLKTALVVAIICSFATVSLSLSTDQQKSSINSPAEALASNLSRATRAIQPDFAQLREQNSTNSALGSNGKHLSNSKVIQQQQQQLQQRQTIPDFVRKFTILGNSTQSRSSSLYHTFLPQALAASTNQVQTSDISSSRKLSSTNAQVTSQHSTLHPHQRTSLLEKICIGTSNRLSSQHNKSDHYQNLVERYKNCTYVIGNLEITWLDKSSNQQSGNQQELDLSFLESIREITGYLLIAYVDVEKIRMPSLRIIRGRDLFKLHTDEKEEFALVLIENELKSLELPNLSEILTGSVGSYNNRNLCHIRTIEWEEILGPNYKSIFVYNNGAQPECPPCDPTCLGHCWGETNEMCQKFSKIFCAPACGGRCFGPTASECCHEFCAGGCTGPNQTDCLACKNFYDTGSCVQECPSMMAYNPSKFLWESNPHGKFAFGATCVKECPENMLRDSGACVRVCPPNKRSFNGECVPCGGPCPKNCQGVEVVHSGNIDQLINCTVIEGSITILDESFNGYSEIVSTLNNNTVRHRPMHPSRLEVFKTLREITGYLNIRAKHPDFKDLSYFTNLKTIGGHQTTDMFHALSITRTSLISLNLRSLRTVRSGKITIEENPDLCFADTIDWRQMNINRREDVVIRNNAENSKCRQNGLQCHEQCARDGCWGPGPDECLSCNNYKLEDYCVVNCNSTESLGFLSYEDSNQNRICKRCHSECRDGCSGIEAIHCLACKNVKDGPYCVPECPSHKYNNNGTCEECDKSCGPDGCSGPSNKLGEGGCNSCAKAIIRTRDQLTNSFDIECVKAEDPCPDGFYQEYVIGSSQPDGSPLKSSSGRPVCRKCHHRCKRCIGMGTHKTVCDCAKYVAGEQCEDHCPRDYFANEESRQCVKCSPECNGCFGPTEADCISCRVYRIYYESDSPYSTNGAASILLGTSHQPYASAQASVFDSVANNGNQNRLRFNCTAQCPQDKPHRISESNMLDPYCSEDPGVDVEGPIMASLGSTTILLIVIISASLMICVSIYRCQIEKDKTVKLTMHLSGIDDVEPLTPSNLKPNLAPLTSIKETELRTGRVLGSGFGGTVYQGFWYPEERDKKKSRVKEAVAIKVLRDNGQPNMNKEFLDEAYIMASVDHPNLVRLLAVCMTPNHLMLVTKLMPLGCLLDYVKKNRSKISAKDLLEWGKQIARGMEYLEEHRMVHRDLALRNVLLQRKTHALISDFGLAKFLDVDQSEYQSGGGRLPIKWLAPECFRKRKFTHKSDVWAFGVTIWELVTFGERPYKRIETLEVPRAIEEGARLEKPSHVTVEIYKVMLACWFYTPEARPNFKQLAQSFVNFARDPERYLICGAKDAEWNEGVQSKISDSEDNYGDEFNSDEIDASMTDEGEVSPTSLTSSQPPLGAAMPDLTPNTHNRMNEMFGFEIAKALSSSTMTTDANNNTITINNEDRSHCWSMHHTISSNSLGQRSEQPTDVYDYLLPSPCTNEPGHAFNRFYQSPYGETETLSVRNPPLSAGLVSNITNEEYFLTRANYVNQKSSHYKSHDNIPQSLV